MTTNRKPKLFLAVTQAAVRASIPKRQVIRHTALFRAELQVELQAANDALAAADRDLAAPASDRDETVEANARAHDAADQLAMQRYEVIRSEVDGDRRDIIRKIDGIEAALKATAPADANVVPLVAAAE